MIIICFKLINMIINNSNKCLLKLLLFFKGDFADFLLEYMNEEEEEEVEEIKNQLAETMGEEELERREAAARKASVASKQEFHRTLSHESEELEHLKVRRFFQRIFLEIKSILYIISFSGLFPFVEVGLLITA